MVRSFHKTVRDQRAAAKFEFVLGIAIIVGQFVIIDATTLYVSQTGMSNVVCHTRS